MKAVYLTGVKKMEVREAPTPRLTGAHDVLLRVDTVGVCGSDIHYYRRPEVGSAVVTYPHVTGHELAATVLEVGAGVKCLRPGQRTAVDPLVPCGECDQCLAGRKHTCRRQKFLGYPGQLPGALVEYLVMPAACCSAVPVSFSSDQAAVVEPLSIGVYAAKLARLAAGARVGIVGSGPIGLCTLLAIRAQTPDTVAYATDLVDERLSVARVCGAAWTGNPQREDVVAAIRRLEPLGLDAVFECAGEQDALDQSVQLLKPGGDLLVIGIPEADRISFNASLLRRNELRIVNVRRQNECMEPAIELIHSGRIDVGPLVTHHFQLEQTADAFEMVSTRKDGVVKALIRVAAV
jgi:L-iditol 2-dehydrogenase